MPPVWSGSVAGRSLRKLSAANWALYSQPVTDYFPFLNYTSYSSVWGPDGAATQEWPDSIPQATSCVLINGESDLAPHVKKNACKYDLYFINRGIISPSFYDNKNYLSRTRSRVCSGAVYAPPGSLASLSPWWRSTHTAGRRAWWPPPGPPSFPPSLNGHRTHKNAHI